MERKYFLGMCDAYGNGQKSCKAFITWELKEDNCFSMCAEIWNPRETDILQGGQCVDSVAKYFPHNMKAQRMVKIWERWHLNDMKADCVHQRESGWNKRRINPKELPNSRANRDEKGILASWVYEKEHPRGFLMKPCPVCGYKYGSAWLKEEIPQKVIDEIKNW
jgi:hypothetical protein